MHPIFQLQIRVVPTSPFANGIYKVSFHRLPNYDHHVKTAKVSSPLDTSADKPLCLEPSTALTPTAVVVTMVTFVSVSVSEDVINHHQRHHHY